MSLVFALLGGVVWAATRANGRQGTEVSTNDGGAWLLKRDSGAIGHLNREVLEVTAGVRVAEPNADFDVDQASGIIIVHDRSAGRLAVIDERTHQRRGEVLLPPTVRVRAVDDGAVVYQTSPLRIWALEIDELLKLVDLDDTTPDFSAESDGNVTVGRSAIAVYVAETDEVVRLVDDESSVPDAGLDEIPTTMTMAGTTVLAANKTQLLLATADRSAVSALPNGPIVLQQSNPSGTSAVFIDAASQLVRVNLANGETAVEAQLAGSQPLAPISHNGCVFTVTTSPATFTKFCAGALIEEVRLAGAGSELRLRLVNGWVWINDIETGAAWITNADTALSRIDDWGAALANEQLDESDATVEDGGGIEEVRLNPDNVTAELVDADQKDDDDENEPPVARDDEGQTRVDRPVITRVLDNDEDADGDVLLVESIESLDTSGAQISITNSRDGVQVTPAAGFIGQIQFGYTVTDGRGGSDSAIGTVIVTAGSQDNNRRPEPVTDVATARAGSPTSLNVLLNDTDPDGDTLALLDIVGDGGGIIFDPSGQITFTPDTTGTDAQVELTYIVVDDFGATAEGRVIVNVRLEQANSSPDARNDSAVTSTGNPARLNVLANDTDPDDDALIVARQPVLVRGPGDLLPGGSGNVDLAQITSDGEFFFIPDEPGTYVFEYLVSDGQSTDLAQIRIDVTSPEQNLPPVAVRDDVTIPIGGTRLVYALDNDGDPNGDVVGIVEWSGADGLIVEEVPGLGFRVTVEPDAPDRAVFRYAISDGTAEPVSTVVVVAVVDVEPVNQPPVVGADAVELRPGRSTTISVLNNDYDPEGGAIKIVRAAEILGVDAQFEIDPMGQTITITLGDDVTQGFSFSYDVADSDGANSAAVVDVRIIQSSEPNRPPVARPDIGRTVQGLPHSVPVLQNDTDPDGDSIRVESIATQPSHGSAEVTPDGAVLYSPRSRFTGTDRFEYVLIDTEGERSVGQVQVGVTATAVENRPPSANNDFFAVRAGAALTLDVRANDFDPDNDRLQIISATEPGAGLVWINNNGQIAFEPPATIGNVDQLELTFSYVISDGHGNSDDARVRLMVVQEPDPEPPVANADQAGPVRGNRSVIVDVVANDSDPDGELADLVVTSTDPAAVVVGQKLEVIAGQESSQHRYTITDADGLSATGTLTVFVVENEAPTLAAFSIETDYETTVSFSLAGQASDPDDDELYFVCCDNAQGGVADIAASSQGLLDVNFVPSPGFSGQASFSYSVDDQAGHLVAGSVTVNVNPPANQPPTAGNTTIEIEAGTTVPVDLTGLASDPDPGDALDFVVDNATGSVATELAGNTVNVTADIDDAGGSGRVEYTVTDRFGERASGSVDVEVVPVSAAPPQAIADSGTTNQGAPVEVDVLGNDIDPLGQGLDLIQVAAGGNGASEMGASPGHVRFTPDPTFFGTTTISYTIRDAAQSPDRESVGQITIDVVGRPAAPAPPSANADNASATVTWSTPLDNGAAVDTYRLEFSSTGGDSGSIDLPVQNSHSMNQLTNGDEYRFRVQARNVAGWGDWSSWSAPVRPDTQPDTPAAPVITFADGELQVNWVEPPNQGSPITAYKLEIGGGSNQVISLGAGTAYTWRSLTNGVEYQFRLAAVNAAGDSDWSGWSGNEHPLGPPLSPAQPAVSRGNQYLDVSWASPSNNGDPISSYEIEMRSSGQRVSVAGGATTNYRWANLANGVAQEFRVRASNRATQPGAWSPWSIPVVPCSIPDAPATAGVNRGDTQVAVTWVAPNDQGCAILSYNIRANGTTIQTAGAGATSHTFTGLTNGTSYGFEVQAVNEEGPGPWSTTSATVVPAGPPTPPTVSSVSATNIGQLSASFGGATNNGSPISRYEVRISGGNPATASSPHLFTGLANNTSYPVQARACNAVGCSVWSGSQSGTTWGPPTAPLAVNASAGNTWWRINWSTPSSNGGSAITHYLYRLNGGTPSAPLSPSSYQVDVPGQPNGVTIFGEIRACNAVGCGAWAGDSATPTAPPPAVTMSKGGSYSGPGCAGTCNWVHVVGTGLPPGPQTVQCFDSVDGLFLTTTRTVAPDGSITTDPCFMGFPRTVWVTVAGVQSNSVLW